jgi:hypothetical protein
MLAVYSLQVFTSALLLFLVQPLFAKMILPSLGGTPSVWNTCMMFFQTVLLGGYLYAHLLTRRLPPKTQVVVHAGLLALSLLALPLALPSGWTPPQTGSPVPWLLLVLVIAIGAPFAMLSSNAPLMQKWFSKTGGPKADNPYPLYATSNLGSLVALLAFPLLIEPVVPVSDQTRAWSVGYGIFFLLTLTCAGILWRRTIGAGGSRAENEEPADENGGGDDFSPAQTRGDEAGSRPLDGVSWRARLHWIVLAFIPSSLLLGVTAHLTTDVAAVPLFWVVPLALYLVTFILVFARRKAKWLRFAPAIQAPLLAAVIIEAFWSLELGLYWLFGLHLAAFFFAALVLHWELAKRRPHPRYLTDFYLWMSVGGALGGVFNAVAAPLLFDSVVEYTWMLVAACLFLPGAARWSKRVLDLVQDAALASLPAMVLVFAVLYDIVVDPSHIGPALLGISLAALGLALASRKRPVFFAASAAGILLAGQWMNGTGQVIHAERSFYGSFRVEEDTHAGVRLLYHGTTLHGAQAPGDSLRLRPLSYYAVGGPAGQLFEALGNELDGEVGVVGLGAGALACYAKSGQSWVFYELDPGVARVATDPEFFTYLQDCPGRYEVVLGDGRLSLSREPEGRFALLVLDAFGSDAIPVHLLTREALAEYLRVLAPDGVLLFHISNRYLDLEPVLAGLAADAGLCGRIQLADDLNLEAGLDDASDWVALTTNEDLLSRLPEPWTQLTSVETPRIWTDDYSPILKSLF